VAEPATEKQLALLKKLSGGKDYTEFGLTKQEASRKIEELMGKVDKKKDEEPKEEKPKKPARQGEDENKPRSMALAYSKDIEVALIRAGGKYDLVRLINRATNFYEYIVGDPGLTTTLEVQDAIKSKGISEDTKKPPAQGRLRGAEDKPVSRPTDEEIKQRLRAKGLTQGEVARNIAKDYEVEIQRDAMAMIHQLSDERFFKWWDSLTK